MSFVRIYFHALKYLSTNDKHVISGLLRRMNDKYLPLGVIPIISAYTFYFELFDHIILKLIIEPTSMNQEILLQMIHEILKKLGKKWDSEIVEKIS